ncbi:deoxyguanosine kinase [Cerasibacillus quisquiliarum]|uniref:Deoxyguanosine kinase n=1 Tax=Cerasibacillus quisquiliarum TaxID=227865 RepID=A0A511UX80_9BACI|nr:deoxynucleoside kinase [Cerasibacillus quisquiliarum]MBB5146547.1 deoxyguanosine kinase [Cerasibacillus quisquiliarum]GEN31246.1 deoxyguanosine kinase [Cerasibacillus quisquiliarum]
MGDVPYIAIEGPIGVGKTSLAERLSSHYGFHLLKEIVDENPFLGKFYENIEEWSFQTEMFFLCNRFKQLEDVDNDYLQKQKPVIADYHIAKNMIFAQRTLKGDKLDKYKQIYDIITDDLPLPNMIIYLHASLDTLLKRIKCRGREIEKNIQPEYLAQLSQDYDVFMKQFKQKNPHIPIIQINGDQVDFVNRKKDLEAIIKQVDQKLMAYSL